MARLNLSRTKNNKLIRMETIVPSAIPLSSTAPTLIVAPLIPEIRTTEVRIRLRDLV